MEEQKLTEQLKACADLFYQNHEKEAYQMLANLLVDVIGAITGEYRNDNAAEGKR